MTLRIGLIAFVGLSLCAVLGALVPDEWGAFALGGAVGGFGVAVMGRLAAAWQKPFFSAPVLGLLAVYGAAGGLVFNVASSLAESGI